MSTPTLTRSEAAARSAAVVPHRCRVDLDLTDAARPTARTFPVEVTWSFGFHIDDEHDGGPGAGDGPEGAGEGASTFLDFTGRVHEVELNGRALSPAEIQAAHQEDRLRLTGLRAQNTVRVRGEAEYSRSGEGLHRYVDPQDQQVYLYTQYEPADAHRVMPCFDQPDLRAEWVFRVQAPEGWQVRSNGSPLIVPSIPEATGPSTADDTRDDTRGDAPVGAVHEFSPTLPIPAYLTAVLAGPYVGVASHWSSAAPGREQSVPLHLWCRASMIEHLDAEHILTITRQGLDFFTELFDLPYPFETYEQAFVPEYNLGAMENPGLVTFTEDHLHPDGATRQQLAGRANTILHEMAHMWFGDLVAIRWWEDLWLKESFAEFMGAHASVQATEFTEAWSTFAIRRKAWAYRQDAMVTTHPIVAEVPDVAAARQNFDGITYAKGAAALKQLVAFVGLEAFTRACRTYFRRHAFGSARLADFLAVLAESSERDTAAWARQWLTTTGATVLELSTERHSGTGALRSARLTPRGTAHDASSVRDHQLVVSAWDTAAPASAGPRAAHDTRAAPTHRAELTLRGRAPHGIDELAGATGVLVVNDEDLDYAEVLVDAPTRADILARLGGVPDPMARAVLWSALWSDVRGARLDAGDFVRAVLQHLFAETDDTVLDTVVRQAAIGIETYLPARRRPEARTRLLHRVARQLRAAAPGSDRQTVLARVLAELVARDGSVAGFAQDLLTGHTVMPGLKLGPDLRWRLLTGLVASNHAVGSSILKEAERDASRIGQIGRARTQAARPTRRAKDEAWAQILGQGLSNDLLSATIEGFRLGDEHLVAPYREQYFAMLCDQWSQRSIGMATRLVRGLYPDDSDLRPGAAVADDEVLRRTDTWLRENDRAPAALRRVVLECRDQLVLRLTAQAAARP